jgi:hypothetical protein
VNQTNQKITLVEEVPVMVEKIVKKPYEITIE